MKKRYTLLALTVLLAGNAGAAVLYSNGPLNGGPPNGFNPGDAFTINAGLVVSDSFTTTGGTATSFTIGTWITPGDNFTAVDWAIGTTTFGSQIASGTASISNVFQFSSRYAYDIDLSTGALPNVVLAPGSYWFSFRTR